MHHFNKSLQIVKCVLAKSPVYAKRISDASVGKFCPTFSPFSSSAFYSKLPIRANNKMNECSLSLRLDTKMSYSTVAAALSLDNISKDSNSRILSFYLKTGEDNLEEFVLPFSWLRDACQCSNCFNPHSLSRIQLMRNFDPDCTPNEVILNSEAEEILITWNDGHKSAYPIDFLRKRNFTKEGESIRKELFKIPPRVAWGTDLQGKIKSFNYKDLIEGDGQSLLKFLEELCVYGLVLIKDCPEDAHKGLANLVSYKETTNYGLDFTVISKPEPSNLAYTSSCLGHHADLPFYELAPGVQLLHCISQENIVGGENQFADGLHCSRVLKELNKLYYEALCTIPIDYYDYGSDYLKDFHLRTRRVTFELDNNGQFHRINFNNQVRNTYLNVSPDKVDQLYRAIKALEDIFMSNSVEHKLKSGEIVVFDNHRCLHARNSYEVQGDSERHLNGWYWRWDEIYSRMRRLKEKITGRSLV